MSEAISQNALKCSLTPPCPRLRVVAVVLAAGLASRMGGQAKCLLQRDGQTLLNRLLEALEAAGIDETVLVLGHNADLIQASLADQARTHFSKHGATPMQVHPVLNPKPAEGQNSSLHLGLAKARTLQAQWVLVALADQPLLEAADLQALIAAVKASPNGTQMLQPWVEGQPGNPVMLSQRVMSDLLSHPQSPASSNTSSPSSDQTPSLPGGKEWRQMHPELCHRWRTNNPHYRVDMDTPEDIASLRAKYGIVLSWGSPT